MLQSRKDLFLKTIKRNGLFGVTNLALRYFEQEKMPENPHYSPTALQIEVTTACNLKCAMCEHTYMRKIAGMLKFEEVKKIIDRNRNIQVLNLTGMGEALLNPEFVKMVKYAKSRGLYVWFNDNFTLMNEEKIEKVLDARADFIVMSFDGTIKKTYEKIRGGAEFEKVTDNFRKLRKAIDDRKLKTKLGINMVVLKENYREIEKMVRLAKALGADNLMFASIIMSDNNGNLSLLGVKSKEIQPFVDSAKKAAEELGLLVIAWPSVELKRGKTGCAYPWSNPYISYNGDVLPCCFIPQMTNARFKEENIMGNVFKEPLSKIWKGEKYRDFRKRMKTSNPPLVCRGCSKFYGQ